MFSFYFSLVQTPVSTGTEREIEENNEEAVESHDDVQGDVADMPSDEHVNGDSFFF